MVLSTPRLIQLQIIVVLTVLSIHTAKRSLLDQHCRGVNMDSQVQAIKIAEGKNKELLGVKFDRPH